jgi:hypothetical protein
MCLSIYKKASTPKSLVKRCRFCKRQKRVAFKKIKIFNNNNYQDSYDTFGQEYFFFRKR